MSFRNRILRLDHIEAGKLIPDSRNWRRHPKGQQDALKAMLGSVGYADALIARETPEGLVIIDGHLRAGLDATQVVPVLVTDLDEAEAGQLLATLDPLAAMAERDSKALQSLVQDLAVGADDAFRALLSQMHHVDLTQPGETDPDDAPDPPAEPVSKRGDIWQLGRHRLMCGDSTDAEDVALLLDGAKPRLMVTDPPYGVNYDASWRNENLPYADRRIGKVTNDISHSGWSGAIEQYSAPVAYVWSPPGDHQIVFASILQQAGYEIRSQLIWRKQTHVISRGHYHWRHEPCWYAVQKGTKAGWIGDRSQSTVWDISWDKNVEGDHSTQKPVECMERPIRNHEGDIYDPFVGSGTTIIAAERQGRACYAMEISEAYVDAAVKRWEKYTGQQALLASSTSTE